MIPYKLSSGLYFPRQEGCNIIYRFFCVTLFLLYLLLFTSIYLTNGYNGRHLQATLAAKVYTGLRSCRDHERGRVAERLCFARGGGRVVQDLCKYLTPTQPKTLFHFDGLYSLCAVIFFSNSVKLKMFATLFAHTKRRTRLWMSVAGPRVYERCACTTLDALTGNPSRHGRPGNGNNGCCVPGWQRGRIEQRGGKKIIFSRGWHPNVGLATPARRRRLCPPPSVHTRGSNTTATATVASPLVFPESISPPVDWRDGLQ